MEKKLPKSIEHANTILETISNQQDQSWYSSQKELASLVALSMSELSSLLKVLEQNNRIRRGIKLPGVRGNARTIVVADSTPLTNESKHTRIGDIEAKLLQQELLIAELSMLIAELSDRLPIISKFKVTDTLNDSEKEMLGNLLSSCEDV